MEGCDEDSMKALMSLQFNANKLHIEFHQKAVALRTKYEANLERMFQELRTRNGKAKGQSAKTVQTDSPVEHKPRRDCSSVSVSDSLRESSLPRNYKDMHRRTLSSVGSNNNNNHYIKRHYKNENNSHIKKNYNDNNSHIKSSYNDDNSHVKSSYNDNNSHIKSGYNDNNSHIKSSYNDNNSHVKSSYNDNNSHIKSSYNDNNSHVKSSYNDNNSHVKSSYNDNNSHIKSSYNDNNSHVKSSYNDNNSHIKSSYNDNSSHVKSSFNESNSLNNKSINHKRSSSSYHKTTSNNSNSGTLSKPIVASKKVQEKHTERPCFWLKVFLNSKYTFDKIQRADQAVLCSMTNLKVNSDLSHLESHSAYRFILEFYFGRNDFFTNAVLTKEYFVRLKGASSNNLPHLDLPGAVYVNCKGCHIDWKQGMNLTEDTSKRTGNKSFFNFFNPPDYWQNEHLTSNQKREVEEDYSFALNLKEKVIPKAISYYMGDKSSSSSNDSSSSDDSSSGSSSSSGGSKSSGSSSSSSSETS